MSRKHKKVKLGDEKRLIAVFIVAAVVFALIVYFAD